MSSVEFKHATGFVAEIGTTILSLVELLKGFDAEFGLSLENGIHEVVPWSVEECTDYIEYLINNDVAKVELVFHTRAFEEGRDSKDPESKMICIDGAERIRAFKMYVNGEIFPFRQPFSDFEDFNTGLSVMISFVPLITAHDKAATYLQLNYKGMQFEAIEEIGESFKVDVTNLHEAVDTDEAIDLINKLLVRGGVSEFGKENALRLFKASKSDAEKLNNILYVAYKNGELSMELERTLKFLAYDLSNSETGGNTTFMTGKERAALTKLKHIVMRNSTSVHQEGLVCQ